MNKNITIDDILRAFNNIYQYKDAIEEARKRASLKEESINPYDLVEIHKKYPLKKEDL
jgi:hypothetical protein